MGSAGFLPPEHYNQIFSAHGTIMIFLRRMPFVIGLMNFAVPLQLGARDVAFRCSTRSASGSPPPARCWSTSRSSSASSRARLAAYPPLSGARLLAGVGVDYYLWALQISGRERCSPASTW
jgi:cytochrome o ubiquinol oxidase subunit 1